MYDHQAIINLIESKFPNLADDLHDEIVDGLLHCQLVVFLRLAQNAIDSKDVVFWEQITKVFMCIRQNCSPDVENALNVSFLEHLNFKDGKRKRAWAYDKMPSTMRKAFNDMEAYNKKFHDS